MSLAEKKLFLILLITECQDLGLLDNLLAFFTDEPAYYQRFEDWQKATKFTEESAEENQVIWQAEHSGEAVEMSIDDFFAQINQV